MPLARIHKSILLAMCGVVMLAGWAWLLRQPPHHLHSAILQPQTHLRLELAPFLSSVVMWQAMTIAMMTPTTLNWILAYAALFGPGESRRMYLSIAAFASGSLLVWLGYSVLGALLQLALQQARLLDHDGRLPSVIAGLVLVGAGVVHFTPLARSCLRHCRNPLTYLLTRWDNGPRGGFRFGLAHGAYCVGCCWALMLTGFAMGLMNLLWMAFLTVLVSLQKLVPHGERIANVFALGMILWGAVLIVF